MKRKQHVALCCVGDLKKKLLLGGRVFMLATPPEPAGAVSCCRLRAGRSALRKFSIMNTELEPSPLTCSGEELYSMVCSSNRTRVLLCLSNPRLTEEHILSLLRNPHITQEIVQTVHDRFSKSYKVQFGIVNCSKTPYALAMRLVNGLFWNDLVKICANFRLSPPLRRAAENALREKVYGLTVGEKKTLAKTAPRPVIGLLTTETEPSVFSCLLRNPRFAEGDLIPVINYEMTPVQILETIASDRQWTNRYPIRLALVRNERTPLRFTLSFLSKLQKRDLEQLVRAPETPNLIRLAADRILTGNY